MNQALSQQDKLARQWNEQFSQSGISFSVDRLRGGVISAEMRNSQGGVAHVSTGGAHLLSASMRENGHDIFYLSSISKYPPLGAIRGGNPLVLGWFGGREGFPSHGFGRMVQWTPIAATARDGVQSLVLAAGPDTLMANPLFKNDAVWGQRSFAARLEVTFSPERIEQTLHLTNTGAAPFDFQGGFHPYFKVSDYRQVSVKGLEELAYLDPLNNRARHDAAKYPISIQGPIERVYLPESPTDMPTTSIYDSALGREIVIGQRGLSHWVVWNPGDRFGDKPSWKEDMDDNRQFVCVEPMHAIGKELVAPSATSVFGISIAERAVS